MSRRVEPGDGGVALVEAAIVLPVVFLLLIGMIEAGFAWGDANTLARATQQAGRTAGRLADSSVADYETLRSIDSALSGSSASSVVRVVVYDAGATGDRPPQACLDLPRPDDLSTVGLDNGGEIRCNVYSAAQVSSDQPVEFGDDTGCAGKWDEHYCPATDRNRTGSAPDRIGVWIELRFDQVTSVLPGSMALTRSAVYELEPCIAGVSTC